VGTGSKNHLLDRNKILHRGRASRRRRQQQQQQLLLQLQLHTDSKETDLTTTTTTTTTTLGVDGVEGGHFVVISIAADLSVPDSSNAFRHSVSDSDIASA